MRNKKIIISAIFFMTLHKSVLLLFSVVGRWMLVPNYFFYANISLNCIYKMKIKIIEKKTLLFSIQRKELEKFQTIDLTLNVRVKKK